MSESVTGNFEEALSVLISGLTRARSSSKLANELLSGWDQRRGNDWYTSTRKQKEDRNE